MNEESANKKILEDIEVVGGAFNPKEKGIEIPPKGALSITSSYKEALMDLKLIGEGYATPEQVKEAREKAKQRALRRAVREGINNARKEEKIEKNIEDDEPSI